MSLTEVTKQTVRERAGCACEYCGVTEQNAGGELTIDHFQPQSKGGGGELENLVYSCVRCNLYKSDFWNEASGEPNLWNPRLEPAEKHFWQTDNGRLLALTEIGELSILTIKLNCPQLIEYCRYQRQFIEEKRLLEESEIILKSLFRLGEDQSEIIRKQQILLDEQRRLLDLLLKNYR